MMRIQFCFLPTCLLVACLTHSLCGQERARITADQLILPGEVFEVGGKQAFLMLPTESTSPQPWVMYAPTLLPQYPDVHEKWMHEQFLGAGIAIAGVDVGEGYGSPAANEAIDALYSELVAQRGFNPKPCLLGRSRGGLWMSSWAIRNTGKLSGIACIYPVFDLTTYPGIAKAAPAYKLTPEQLEKQLEQLNPIRSARKLADAKIPFAIIHGAIDKLVPLKENSAELKRIYSEAGHESLVNLIVIEDQGHNHWPGFFNCQTLVDFAIAKATGELKQ